MVPVDRVPRNDCVLAPETYLDHHSPLATGAVAFASVGLVMTAITAVVMAVHWQTPVVKACSRELNCVLIVGTFFSFCTTFVMVARPTPATCGVTRFLLGFCYTLCYAAVVTKTNRISRIFSAATRGATSISSTPRCTSPAASVTAALLLTAVEVVVNTAWLVVQPAGTVHILDPATRTRILVCDTGVNGNFMIGLAFPLLLLVSATAYAFKTRKCPCGFNETRFILFTNSINTIHWLVFVPLYLISTDYKIRAVILAYSLSLSGLVQLGCLVFPKLVYTVLFKPEKNTRDAVMLQHRSAVSTLPTPPPNSLYSHVYMGPDVVYHTASSTATSTTSAASSDPPTFRSQQASRGRRLTWTHDHYLRSRAGPLAAARERTCSVGPQSRLLTTTERAEVHGTAEIRTENTNETDGKVLPPPPVNDVEEVFNV